MLHEEKEEEEEGVSQTWFNRILNILICRGDLAEEKLEAAPVSIRELFRYSTSGDRICVAVGLILSIIVGALQPLTCIVAGYVANLYLKDSHQIGNDKMWSDAMWWALLSGIIGASILVGSYIQTYLLTSTATRVIRRIRSQFIRAVLRQNAAWFDHTEAGAISSQLNENIEQIYDGIGDKMGLILRGFSSFIFSVLISFVINWKTTVVSIGVGPLGAITMGLMARFSAAPMKKMMCASEAAGALAEESVMNVKTVAACNGQRDMIQKYADALRNGLKYSMRVSFVNGFFEGCMFFQLYAFFCAGLLYGTVSYYGGDDTEPGSILAATNSVLLGGYFLSLLGPHMMSLLKARVAAAVIYKTIDKKVENVQSKQHGLSDCRGRIQFQDVHFQYPTRDTPILTGCSWDVSPGETIAFVGHSGCGKSTSIGLLTRLYDATSGSVRLDDISIENIEMKFLRKVIGIVQQEPSLFNGTIMENIVLGREISEESVESAAKTANAHDFIQKLPEGYNTVLGSGGVSLSGGQKQRIAIARAIAGDPKILLLDEATSALDTESERIVQAALEKASRGRTTIMIAHRLSTLKHVNRIHVIEKGKVVEIGSHSELMSKDGVYAALARAQEVGLVEKRKKVPSETMPVVSSPSIQYGVERCSNRSSRGRTNISTFGIVPEVTADEDNETEQKKPNGRWWYFPLIQLYFRVGGGWKMWITIICCCLRGMELPAYAYLQIIPFNALQQTKDTYLGPLWDAVIAFMVVGIYIWFFIFTAIGFGGWASEELVNKLRLNVIGGLLHQDASFFDGPNRSNAACASTLAMQTPNVLACLDYRFMLVCNNIVSLFVCLFLTFTTCWPTGVASLLLILIFVSLLFLLSKITVDFLGRKAAEDHTAQLAIEIFEQARTIQLLAVEDYFADKYEMLQEEAKTSDSKLHHLQSATFAISLSFLYFSDMFCYSIGAYMIYYGRAIAAKAYVATLCANFSGWSVLFAAPTFNDMAKANSATKTLFRLISDGKCMEHLDAGTKPEIKGDFSVEKVYFSYPTRPHELVARGLNLRASKGEAIALVGASGCGKSTVIQLIERFYTANQGSIKVDNMEIGRISLKHLRKHIALVGSIFENIKLGCDGATLEDVRKAAEKSNAARFIEAFPEGYSTDVGEKGKSLSGGQKQRIAIARALIRDPRILLLDEATSALDTQSEEIVQRALNEASHGRTSITIAHRLSTIRKADRIYFIENGSVVEYGTHDELIEAEGKYARLVAAQELEHKEE